MGPLPHAKSYAFALRVSAYGAFSYAKKGTGVHLEQASSSFEARQSVRLSVSRNFFKAVQTSLTN